MVSFSEIQTENDLPLKLLNFLNFKLFLFASSHGGLEVEHPLHIKLKLAYPISVDRMLLEVCMYIVTIAFQMDLITIPINNYLLWCTYHLLYKPLLAAMLAVMCSLNKLYHLFILSLLIKSIIYLQNSFQIFIVIYFKLHLLNLIALYECR